MADIINGHGKRYFPEPTIAFPRLVKPASPVNFKLPRLDDNFMRVPPPQMAPLAPLAMPMTPPPSRSNSGTGIELAPSPPAAYAGVASGPPLPGVPQIAAYMQNNRVSDKIIPTQLPKDTKLNLDICKSSKDLIEMAKLFDSDLTNEAIGRVLDLRDTIFSKGGVYVFTFEQFVQFYSFYNLFLTEERSWDPRLSEKFACSSRTRLRCSCRHSPRLARRKNSAPSEFSEKTSCSVTYNMSFWPMHKLVVWECLGAPNHPMKVNAMINTCQYTENLVGRLNSYSLDDIGVLLRAQLAPHLERLWLPLFDTDRIRSLLRNSEEVAHREPNLERDVAIAAQLTQRYASPDLLSRYVDLGHVRALVLLHKDVFRELFFSQTLVVGTNYKVCVHFDKVSLVTLTTESGRHGASIFLPLDETSSQFKDIIHSALRQVEQIGYEFFGNHSGFVGLANIRHIKVSLNSQIRVSRLTSQTGLISSQWLEAMSSFQPYITSSHRLERDVQDRQVLTMIMDAYSCASQQQAEGKMLEAIQVCVDRSLPSLEARIRKEFQLLPKVLNKWTVETGSFYTCFDGSNSLPFTFKHSMAGTALQFAAWLAQSIPIRPTKQARIGINSVLCTPPPSDD